MPFGDPGPDLPSLALGKRGLANAFVFRCDATADVALGHLRRCLSLAHALDEKGASVGFACFDDPAARQLLDGTNFNKFWLSQTVNESGDIGATIKAAGEMEAGVVVVDSYSVDQPYFGALRKAKLTTAYFEDEMHLDWEVDVIINGLIGAEAATYKASTTLLGPRHLVLGMDYWNPPVAPPQDATPLEIMITMGGIDHYNLTERLLVLLDRCQQPLRIHVVIGQYYENEATIEKASVDSRHDIVMHRHPDGIADIIRHCQLAVSAGGITLYELAAFGVPTLGIWLWENQRRNVEQLGKARIIMPLGYEAGPGFDEKISDSICDLIKDAEVRRKMSRAGLKTVDGRGARRVAQTLSALAGPHRNVISGLTNKDLKTI